MLKKLADEDKKHKDAQKAYKDKTTKEILAAAEKSEAAKKEQKEAGAIAKKVTK